MSKQTTAVSPAVKLCAFFLLVLLLFVGAREVGRALGPVGGSAARSSVTPGGNPGGMNMSAGNTATARSGRTR
jgi:hypothetical protein